MTSSKTTEIITTQNGVRKLTRRPALEVCSGMRAKRASAELGTARTAPHWDRQAMQQSKQSKMTTARMAAVVFLLGFGLSVVYFAL